MSFPISVAFLAALPFSSVGLAAWVALSAAAAAAVGRPQDATTAAITTAVVLVVAGFTPGDTWQTPLLRLADTVAGIVIGLAGAALAARV